jgi:hypothetical protein
MKTLLAAFLALAATTAPVVPTPSPVIYRFDQVKRKVMLTTPKQELQAAAGQQARSGDKVSTGWFAYALIASEQHRARFELFSSTDVVLAEGAPGVILSLERGKLHAMFDKITGSEPRVVKTPGALLAVRGTQYTVEVDQAGHTNLEVFEGIVEIRSPLRPEPMLIRAGQAANFSRQEPPKEHPIPPRNDPNHRNDGNNNGDPSHNDGHGAPGDPHGGPPNGRPPAPPPPQPHGSGQPQPPPGHH